MLEVLPYLDISTSAKFELGSHSNLLVLTVFHLSLPEECITAHIRTARTLFFFEPAESYIKMLMFEKPHVYYVWFEQYIKQKFVWRKCHDQRTRLLVCRG